MSIKLKTNFTVLIAGGTGGHMYPAIAILDEKKKKITYFLLQIKEVLVT